MCNRETGIRGRQGPRTLVSQVKDTKQWSLGREAGQSSQRHEVVEFKTQNREGVEQSEDSTEAVKATDKQRLESKGKNESAFLVVV